MKLQKLLSLLLALAMVLALVGCNSGTQDDDRSDGKNNKTNLSSGNKNPEDSHNPGSNDKDEAWTVHSKTKAQVPHLLSFLHVEDSSLPHISYDTVHVVEGYFDPDFQYLMDEYIQLLETCYHLKAREKTYTEVILDLTDTVILFDYVGDDPNVGTYTDTVCDNPTGDYYSDEEYDVEFHCYLSIMHLADEDRLLVHMKSDDGFELVDYGERSSQEPTFLAHSSFIDGGSNSGSGSGSGSGIGSGSNTTTCGYCGGVGYLICQQCEGDGWMETSGYVPGYGGEGGHYYEEKKPCTNPRCEGGKKYCQFCS